VVDAWVKVVNQSSLSLSLLESAVFVDPPSPPNYQKYTFMSTFSGPSLTSNQVEVIFVSSEGDKPPPFQFPEIQGATHVTPLPPTTPNSTVMYSGTTIDPSLPLRFSFGGLDI